MAALPHTSLSLARLVAVIAAPRSRPNVRVRVAMVAVRRVCVTRGRLRVTRVRAVGVLRLMVLGCGAVVRMAVRKLRTRQQQMCHERQADA